MGTEEKINELLGSIDEKKESIFINYVNGGNCLSVASGSYEDIADSFKTLILSALRGSAPKKAKFIAASIIDAANGALCEYMLDDKEEDSAEDCDNCELANVCEQDKAVFYRKANGISDAKRVEVRKINVN